MQVENYSIQRVNIDVLNCNGKNWQILIANSKFED